MTLATAAPTRPPTRPAAPSRPATTAPAQAKRSFAVSTGIRERASRVVLYGTKGIGKTSLAGLAPDPLFIDCEQGSDQIDVARVGGLFGFQDVRDALHEPSLWKDRRTVVVDTATALQEWAVAHTIANVKHEKGHAVNSIEGYGFGKGFQHVADTFLTVLADLDAHINAGRNVIVICHDTVEKAPNPDGEDYLRYEPALQQPPKNGRIRDRIAQWCDHLLFLQYDMTVKNGKAQGQGTRTLYPQERPTYWAKSRILRESIDIVEGDRAVWDALGLK